MEKRSALQKAVLISVAVMAVAFAILTFVFHRLEGVKFEEGFLRVSAQADDPAATVYAGKVQGERVKITVTDCPDEQRTEVVVQVGDRVRDECAVETGLPPIQADQLGPVEHIRITRNGQLLFEGGYTAEHDMGWYDLEGNWDPFTMSVSYSSTAGDDYWEHYETDRGTILSFARGPQLVSRGSWMLYFTMLLFSGLLADYAREKGAHILLKGVRNATDWDMELQMARINQGVLPGLETLLLPASAEYEHFSSTMAREMIHYGQPLEKYLPAPIAEELEKTRG